MILNPLVGGLSYIAVTAPSGTTITASCSGVTRTGSGTCTLECPIVGTWSVSCTIDGITKTVNVTITSYGQTKTQFFAEINATVPGGTVTCEGVSRSGSGKLPVAGVGSKTVSCTYDSVTHSNTVSVTTSNTSYSTSFTYSCTINVSCPSDASVVVSRTGYSNVTGTGSGSLVVPKSGNWTVTVTIGSGAGVQSKQATVTADYDTPKSCSLYPRRYLYICNKGSGHYYGAGGLTFEDADHTGAEYIPNDAYGAWSMAGLKSYDTGNNILYTTNAVDLTGYDKMYMVLRYADGASIIWGLSSSGNKWASESWERRQTIHAGSKYSRDDSPSYPNFYTQTFDFTNVNGSLYPIIRNLDGLPDSDPPGSSHVMIQEWYLE